MLVLVSRARGRPGQSAIPEAIQEPYDAARSSG
jgi:hypothetical protein